MTPAPTDTRILDALQLQPMTVEQLAKCLSLYRGTVRKRVQDLRQDHLVRAIRSLPTRHGRPWPVYSINLFRQTQRGTA